MAIAESNRITDGAAGHVERMDDSGHAKRIEKAKPYGNRRVSLTDWSSEVGDR